MSGNLHKILLTTINSRYSHPSLGLRYLYANLQEWQERCDLVEFTLQDDPTTIAERLLERRPSVIGFSVYIWNIESTTQVVSIVRKVAPETVIVIGGPEVSFEYDQKEIFQLCDYLIPGEADVLFAELVRIVDEGGTASKVFGGELPNIETLTLPYRFYGDQDITQKVVYVEASRGCPYRCEFCLSALDSQVRRFPQQQFLSEMRTLLDRGCRSFKFVDRTFNLHIPWGVEILKFFLNLGHFDFELHFEVIPDRFPAELKDLVKDFPAGVIQFEIGIQTLDPKVLELISRKMDWQKTSGNLQFLLRETGVYVHADLIFGLPGENWQSFQKGFDELYRLRPHEIQVGILKRLSGTPIVRHQKPFGLVFSERPPYEILQTDRIGFTEVQTIKRFARFFDLYSNSGDFSSTMPMLICNSGTKSPFAALDDFFQWCYQRLQRTSHISLQRRVGLIFEYLTKMLHQKPEVVVPALIRDYYRKGYRKDFPQVLKAYVDDEVRDLIASYRKAAATEAISPLHRKKLARLGEQ